MYITDEERKKCQKVADAFTELYELTDMIVVDAGKYGFVKLQYYNPQTGFDSMDTFTDSQEMFHDLWKEWFNYQVLAPVLGTPLVDLDYWEIFELLPEEKRREIMDSQRYFEEKSR